MPQPLSISKKADYLSRAKMFRSVSYNSLEHIASITEQSLYEEGEVICNIGDPASYACVIVSGEVEVTLPHQDEHKLMRAGDIFGEYALFNQGKRTASLKASRETLVLTIHYDQFKSFLISDASACLAILKETVERLLLAEQKLIAKSQKE